jgi:hypothetical protein
VGPEIIKAGGKQPPNVPPAPKAADAPPPAPDLPGCRPGTVTIGFNTETPCTVQIGDLEYPGTMRFDFASGEWWWRPTPEENP